ncbi:hypothetical protein JXA48_02930 [Candidatus Woesearchaeota archaeon]|nr:hypothetical protein [Candidatus Woesearchaeota archaeon]
MVFTKIVPYLAAFLLLIGLVSAALATANIVNSLPTLTITSMNLNPGTSRDIYSFITDPNGNTISCSYCVDNNCYQTCRIYAPRTPGIYRINITLNDTINVTNQQLTIFVPGEVPQKPSSTTADIPSIPEKNPSSPYNNSIVLEKETDNQTTTARDEAPIGENDKQNSDVCSPEVLKEKALTGKDVIFSIIILGLLGVILMLLEKDHNKKRKERHEKIATLGEIFTEEEDE